MTIRHSDHPTARNVWIRPVHGGTNPYTVRFANALDVQGMLVAEMPDSPVRLPRAPGVLIFHWPNEFFKRGSPRAALRTWLMLARLAYGHARYGQKLVWVVHNLAPHEAGVAFPAARSRFFRLLDGLVFLSASSRDDLLRVYPELANTPYLVTRHGDYRLENQSPPELPVTSGRRVRFGMFGHLRRYKQPELLARLVAGRPDAELVIAGTCKDAELRAELIAIANSAENITLRLEFLEDTVLESLTDKVDAVVLPYRAILNSGSALHALTRFRPVIAPRLGSLTELQTDVSTNWVQLYDGALTSGALDDACVWAARPRPTPPDLSRYDWSAIGCELAKFTKTLASGVISKGQAGPIALPVSN